MQAKHQPIGAIALGRIALVAVAVAIQTGCSSPFTTMALREFLRESTMTLSLDSEAEESAKPDDGEPADRLADVDTASEADEASAEEGSDEVPVERRIERSLERLAQTRGFDPLASDVLAETLEKAATEDWPAIIDSFAASLEASPPQAAADASQPPVGTTSRQTVGGLTVPIATSVPVVEPVPQPQADDTVSSRQDEQQPPAIPEESPEESPEAVAAESPEKLVCMLQERLAEARRKAPLTVRRGCFASRVRGWGNLDVFDEPKFVPGQDVLVYFELDNLDGIANDQGFTTRVETRLRLVDATGAVAEAWSFPVVEDRADSPRTDYFVRYLVRIPAGVAPGHHRPQAVITDAVSAKTVATDLAVEIASDDASRGR